MDNRTYIAIDLKSFYASVECVERGLDPLNTNLVVADESRTDKTICLAVTPPLKSFGIPGRPRLFEVKQRVNEVNRERRRRIRYAEFKGKSHFYDELIKHKDYELDFITAPPRMAYYMEYSTRIYEIYSKYVSPQDIVVYSIDEVFMDVTSYIKYNGLTAHDFAMKIIKDVLKTTGITATVGIGTNLYLCKIAMDIVAKKMKPDENGVRIAELDEMSYRKSLWTHTPITDFWRVGGGSARRLASYRMYTMGDVARCSLENEKLLYKLFGKNAELLIDHAWGYEPCTIPDIKAYRPSSSSLCSGQVLQSPYECDKARIVLTEMTDALVLDLVEKCLVTKRITVTIGYDIENLTDDTRRNDYDGEVVTDRYGRKIPKHAHGTVSFDNHTSSGKKIVDATLKLYDRIINDKLLIRRINISAEELIPEGEVKEVEFEQHDLFTDVEELKRKRQAEQTKDERERRRQRAVIQLKKKFGKNALLKAVSLEEGATAKDRNRQIGGHKA